MHVQQLHRYSGSTGEKPAHLRAAPTPVVCVMLACMHAGRHCIAAQTLNSYTSSCSSGVTRGVHGCEGAPTHLGRPDWSVLWEAD